MREHGVWSTVTVTTMVDYNMCRTELLVEDLSFIIHTQSAHSHCFVLLFFFFFMLASQCNCPWSTRCCLFLVHSFSKIHCTDASIYNAQKLTTILTGSFVILSLPSQYVTQNQSILLNVSSSAELPGLIKLCLAYYLAEIFPKQLLRE